MDWYYAEAGNQVGPLSEADFEQLVNTGKVSGETLVWRPGLKDWQPLKEVQPEEQNLGFRTLVDAWRHAAAEAAGGVDEYFILADRRDEDSSAVLGDVAGHTYSSEGAVACAN